MKYLGLAQEPKQPENNVKYNSDIEKIKDPRKREDLREMKWLPGMTQEKYDNEIKEALKIIKDFNIDRKIQGVVV